MYRFTSSLPTNLVLETPFTSGLKPYHTLIKCTDSNCDINSVTLSCNGVDVSETYLTKIDVDTYELNLNGDNNDNYHLTGSLKTVQKPFRLMLTLKGCKSSIPAGVYNSSTEFDITFLEGYGRGRAIGYINSVRNNKFITETETGYHIKILENDYNANDIVEFRITTVKLKSYTVSYTPDSLIFSPAITGTMTTDYRGNVTPPDNYHFINLDVTLNGKSCDSCYKVNAKSYRVEFNRGEGETENNYVVTARIEEDITETNEDKYPFIRIYNPTNQDLDKLSEKRYVNGNNQVVEDIANDIIDLQKIYINIPKNQPYKDMLIGKKNTGIKVNQVLNTEITIDCGSITIDEVYHNIADYTLTNIMFYIPFVGLREVDTDLIMNHEVGLKYDVSIISGDFIATLYLRDIDKTIELFSGNMSYKIPYTSDYQNNINGDLRENDKSMIDLTPYCIIKSHLLNPSPYTKTIREYMKLEDLTGFTIIDNIELYVDENVNMLYDEEKELCDLMKAGIVL